MVSTNTSHESLFKLNILVVDDSRFNQRMAQMILQQNGSLVTIAGDGEEALSIEEKFFFDVILMDVEMPKLDGFQATAMIRAREKSGRHVPIIAMSAHPSAEYRERCMAAGMDGYIEKPIDPAGLENEVRAIWEKFQRGVGGNGVDPTITAVFDRQEFLNRIYRDRALLLQVTELFQEDAPSKLADLRSAMERKDPVAVAKAAHALKGMVSNFSAYRAQRIAHSVETAARSEILLGGPELVNQLGEQIEQLTTQLLALAGEPAS